MKKIEIRKSIAARFGRVQPGMRETWSREIVSRLIGSAEWESSQTVLLYNSIQDEVDTSEIITTALVQEKSVCLPRVIPESEGRACGLSFHRISSPMDAEEKNNLGIGEPSPDLPRFDPEDHAAFPVVVVIPGRAFDRKCNRVGRGMGYYDRFLRDLLDRASGPVFLVGVCFCFQIVPSIQTGTSDVPMDIVIAENARIG